jgi:hypothetical protein
MCGLMLQIMETRMLSVIGHYNLAFFAIGVAMLGMTAGALLVFYRFETTYSTARLSGTMARDTVSGSTRIVCRPKKERRRSTGCSWFGSLGIGISFAGCRLD